MASKPQHSFRIPGSAVIRSFVEQDAGSAPMPTLAPVPPPLPLAQVEPLPLMAVEPVASEAESKLEARVDSAALPPPSEPPALTTLGGAEPANEPGPSSRPRQARAVRTSLPKAKGRKTVVRADGREVRKLGVYLDASLARKLALFCAEEGLDLSDVVSVAVEKFLGHGR